MNYYDEIKSKLIENDIYSKVKDYSKERNRVITYFEIGRLLNQSNTTIFLGKKTASKILFSKDGDSYKKDFKDKFLLKYDVLYSFDDVIKDIDFKERKSENDSAFSGGIKSIVLFIII